MYYFLLLFVSFLIVVIEKLSVIYNNNVYIQEKEQHIIQVMVINKTGCL